MSSLGSPPSPPSARKQFEGSESEKLADRLSSVRELDFVMQSQALARRTLMEMSHPLAALYMGEI